MNENIQHDVGIENNLILGGNFNIDYDALGEINFRWDRDHDFSEKVHTYNIRTNFNQIGEDFTKFLETKISMRIERRNVSPDTLKPSQKLAHDVLVRMDTREPGTSKTDDPESSEN